MNLYQIGLGPGNKQPPQMSHGKSQYHSYCANPSIILELGKTRGEREDQGE